MYMNIYIYIYIYIHIYIYIFLKYTYTCVICVNWYKNSQSFWDGTRTYTYQTSTPSTRTVHSGSSPWNLGGQFHAGCQQESSGPRFFRFSQKLTWKWMKMAPWNRRLNIIPSQNSIWKWMNIHMAPCFFIGDSLWKPPGIFEFHLFNLGSVFRSWQGLKNWSTRDHRVGIQ